MARKWLVIGLFLAVFGVSLWIARLRPDDSTDYKELYRELFHQRAADMEVIQRRRHEQAK